MLKRGAEDIASETTAQNILFYDGRFPYLDVCGQMGPIPPLSVSPYLYLPAIRGDIKIPGSDKWNQSREI